MESNKNKREVFITAIITYLLVWICATLIWGIAGAFPGADFTFMAGDLLAQYVDFIHMFLRHLFHGQNMVYSFEYGMGMPTWATYAYYTLSPFNLIFAIVSDLDLAAFLVVVAKLATAGAVFVFLLQYTSKPTRPICISFSLAYALCGYSMHFYLGIIFLDSLYWMPLLLIALKRFVDTGRWRLLCLIYAYMFIVQFYAGYMSGIFSFVVYLSYAGGIYGKDRKKWINSIGHYSICVMIAIALSAVVTLPAGIELFRLMASDTTKFEGVSISINEVLGCFYPMEWTNNEGLYNRLPAVYVGLPVWIMMICFFGDSKVAGVKKLILGIPILFHLLCIFWKPMYMMIHGFDAPDGYDFRFTGQMALWMILTASFWVTKKQGDDPERDDKTRLWRIVCAGGAILYIVLLMYQKKQSSAERQYLSWNAAEIILVLLALYAMIGYGKTLIRRSLLAIVFVFELVINGWMLQHQTYNNVTRDGDYYDIWQDQANSSLAWVREQEKEDQEPFYRIRYLNGPGNNISMLYGYNGVGYFSSLEYEKTRDALNRLGYATSSRIVKDYGSTMLTRMLFAQKYNIVCGYFGGDQREKYMVDRSELCLPIAFVVSEDILNYHAYSTDAFENLNHLASALAGEKFEPYPESVQIVQAELDNMQVDFEDGYVLMKRLSDNTAGKMTINLPKQGDGEEYAYVSRFGEADNDSMSAFVVSEKDLGSFFEASYVTMPHVLPLSINKEGDLKMQIIMNSDGYPELTYETMNFACEDVGELRKLYEYLLAGSMDISYVADGVLRGKVTARDGRQVLYTSIPYDEYWKAKIDGEPVETSTVLDGAFLALVLPEGEHEISIEYINPWIRRGCLVSLLGIAAVLIMSGIAKRKENADE